VSVPNQTRTGGDPLSFGALLHSVQASGEDFEWYPTTDRMIEVVFRWLDKTADSIMDIGAGDGRVLAKLSARFEAPPALYAIEKSTVLIQAQPENVIPVGTDVFEQNLACLPVDYIFCNPPYSEFETWACMVIESGHARKAFLVLPQRWKRTR
jgi:tRNA1(Val) A37 N6-methylase TrmN6